jgi:hypothetical protein
VLTGAVARTSKRSLIVRFAVSGRFFRASLSSTLLDEAATRRKNITNSHFKKISLWELLSSREKRKKGVKSALGKKGSSLPLTLINTVLYFPYLFFNFSVMFFKLRNSS